MNLSPRIFSTFSLAVRGFAVLILLLLTACAGDFGFTPQREQVVFVDNLNVTAMNQVIQRGIAEIKSRAYEDPDIDALFIAALGGVSSIDKELAITVADGHVKILGHGVELKDVGPAPHDSILGWSRATLLALLNARRYSGALHAADEEALYQAMFVGAISKLDPYSRYSSREVAVRTRLVRDGVIGLGIRVETVSGGVQVQAIVADGPTEKAGITINDIIVSADGVRLAKLPLADARRRLDGLSESMVTLVVKRPGVMEPFTVMARRELIVPDTVTSTVVNGVAELKITSFNQRTAAAVARAVDAARHDARSNAQDGQAGETGDLKGIVIDFRGDPGGLLDQAVDVADMFLDGGSIITLSGRHPGAHQYYASHQRDIAPGIPIAILVDGRTASAAEIVAAALQDNGRAVVVGTETLGKGSVQTVVRLPNGGEFALTWAHTTTPRGAALHGLGILPDVCLAETDHAVPTLDQALAHVTAAAAPSLDDRSRWRLPKDDEATHEALRTACPAETDHPARALDMDVAARLMNDPVLLARAAGPGGAQFAVKP